MEALTVSATSPLTPTTGTEVSASNKADCYFYYYSSCNKGNTCPYRHEPAALRNETMCLYWLKGSCNKPNCIYRHMEITKKRDKIACFFESQPGGCKKLHCPFLHENVFDQPREEDVPKHNDLILPVKDSEADYETEESETARLEEFVEAQLRIQRKLSSNPEANPESPTPFIARKSFIVPLQDGESDSESVSLSPVKTAAPTRRCIVSEAERDWELERLREIQKEEGNLLGYTFASEEEHTNSRGERSNSPSSVTYVYEEMEEFIEEEDHDSTSQTILRKSFPRSQGTEARNGLKEGYIKRVLGNVIKKVKKDSIFDKLSPHSLPEEYLVTTSNNSNPLQSGLQTALSERLGPKQHNSQRLSIKERLGRHKLKEEENDVENKPKRISLMPKEEESVKKRLGSSPKGVKSRITLKDDQLRERRMPEEEPDRSSASVPNLEIKSLADIRAEKEKQKQRLPGKRPAPNRVEALPLSALINRKKSSNTEEVPDVGNLKIKTLAEIRAEKEKSSVHARPKLNSSLVPERSKRPISPIHFESSSVKKSKVRDSTRTNVKSEAVSNTTVAAFSPRKLALKRANNNNSNSNNKNGINNRVNPPKPLPKSASQPIPKSDLKPIPSIEPRKETLPSKTSCENLPRPDKAAKSNSTSLKDSNKEERPTPRPNVSRLDSFMDEEELLLDADLNDFDDDDIDEDELLL